jgi:hypothetical protein
MWSISNIKSHAIRELESSDNKKFASIVYLPLNYRTQSMGHLSDANGPIPQLRRPLPMIAKIGNAPMKFEDFIKNERLEAIPKQLPKLPSLRRGGFPKPRNLNFLHIPKVTYVDRSSIYSDETDNRSAYYSKSV